MHEETAVTEERRPDVIMSMEHAEKMVNVSYEALATLRDRLSSVMRMEDDSKSIADNTSELCPMALRIFNIGGTASSIFDGLMDIINRLEF